MATWWATSSSAICRSTPIRGIVPALALAPVAVRPDHQKRGIGSALIRAGLAACRADGHRIVVVLGHAEYYPRFGFSAKLAEPLASPFSGKDSWMALELVPGALDGVVGAVQYAPPFGIEPPARSRFASSSWRDLAVCKLPHRRQSRSGRAAVRSSR